MGRTLIILTFLLNPFLVNATEQSDDILLYKGDTVYIDEYPLEELMIKDSILANRIYKLSNCFITSCWRQHIGTWKIENDSLFLVDLKSCCDNKKIPLDNVFHKTQLQNDKLFAQWYSGVFYSGFGKYLGFSEKKWEYVYDNKIKIQIKNGKVADLEIWKSTDTTGLYNPAREICPTTYDSASNKVVYIRADEQPTYPGGYEELYNWIYQHLEYPNDDVEGKVFVQFIVDTNGEIVSPSIIKGFNKKADEFALRVFSIMPNWNSGYCNDKAVPVRMILPIKFAID